MNNDTGTNTSNNIFQRMAAITADLQTVSKNLMVETGKGKGYKAVSERDVIDAVKPLEAKHGVYSYPVGRELMESQTLESESEWNGKVTKKTTFFSRIKTTYRFVNVDDPEDYIETITFAEGIDSQDKGSGKAMTYGDKYALMKAYKMSTGDDPDQQASADVHYKRSAVRCQLCGTELVPVTGRDGSTWTVEDMIKYSNARFEGRTLCPTCQKREIKAGR